MAYYNTATKEIIGAKEGTLIYKHEYGHKLWNDPLNELPGNIKYNLILLSLLLISANKSIFVIWIVSSIILYDLLEESICWMYAFTH